MNLVDRIFIIEYRIRHFLRNIIEYSCMTFLCLMVCYETFFEKNNLVRKDFVTNISYSVNIFTIHWRRFYGAQC